MFVLQLFDDNTGEWFELDETGLIISRQMIHDLLDCPKVDPDAQFTVLFPGENLLLVSMALPKLRGSEQLKAIVYGLEEQLATDPDEMYVAIGQSQSNGNTVIAMLEKKLMEAKVASWADANLSPRQVVPDFLGIAWESNAWSIVLKNKIALVRTAFDDGFAVDYDNLSVYLELALEKYKDQLPERIICWQRDNLIDPTTFTKLNIPIEFVDEAKRVMFDVESLTTRLPVNLMQGKFRPAVATSKLRKNWIFCLSAASAFFLFLFVNQFSQWAYFTYQSRHLEKQVLVAYQALFPGATAVLEPHFRTSELLKKYAAASDGGHFLTLLDNVGKVILQFPQITLQSLDYQHQQLRVHLQLDKMDTLNNCMQRLRDYGLLVDQHISSSSPKNIEVDLMIKES